MQKHVYVAFTGTAEWKVSARDAHIQQQYIEDLTRVVISYEMTIRNDHECKILFIKGENKRHDHVLITVNNFSIKRKTATR